MNIYNPNINLTKFEPLKPSRSGDIGLLVFSISKETVKQPCLDQKIQCLFSKYSYFLCIFWHKCFRAFSYIPKYYFKVIKSGTYVPLKYNSNFKLFVYTSMVYASNMAGSRSTKFENWKLLTRFDSPNVLFTEEKDLSVSYFIILKILAEELAKCEVLVLRLEIFCHS